MPTPTSIDNDPINRVDVAFLRQRAQAVLTELLSALDGRYQQTVSGIPLVVDDAVGEVNAFAACSNGRAAMAITDGLLQVEAYLAQAAACDEVFGTQKLNEYITAISRAQRPGAPIQGFPRNFMTGAQHSDSRKVVRQHQLLDEQIAFVLGHELAHHYLGHLPCTGANDLLSAAGRVLSNVAPVFNQGYEFSADVQGTGNVLTAGARRAAHFPAWTERGGLLTMQFFSGLQALKPEDLLFAFDRTHPPPQLRIPVIQQTANSWRLTGGGGFKLPGWP